MTKEHVKTWIKNFIKSFGAFEDLLATTLKKYGEDTQLQPDFLAVAKTKEEPKNKKIGEITTEIVVGVLYVIATLLTDD